MNVRLPAALGAWLACAGLAPAQPPATLTPIAQPPSAISVAEPTLTPDSSGGWHLFPSPGATDCGPRFWASSEYLLWWLKDAPLPVPIATRGSAADPIPGALGQHGTSVFSPNHLDYAPFSGTRATAGLWLGDDRAVGAEASGFLLESRSARFVASNLVPGGTVYYVPFLDLGSTPPAENAFPFGNIGSSTGKILAVSSTRLWGAEANALLNLLQRDRFRLTLLGGLRYLDLSENLQIDAVGLLTPAPGAFTSFDAFGTRNQFWGGQLGVRGEMNFGKFFANLGGKVALGDMHESVGANGYATAVAPDLNASVAGGFFTLPSNIGRHTADVFAVIPQASVQVGYEVTRRVRIFAGYEFLYVSDVVRPGDQVDRRINFSQQAAPFGVGKLSGPAAPVPEFHHTDFWAHGLSFGVAFRY